MLLEIEIYEDGKEQETFLFRGYDDVYWTSDIDSLVSSVEYEVRKVMLLIDKKEL